MKFKIHPFWLVIVVVYCAYAVTPALAHALLLRSHPAANAVLEQPPVQVEIFFSEALEANLSSITVLDSNGLAVDAGDLRVDPADPTRLTVSLHRLTDGVYTVTWKAVSAVDGHQTVGTFPFAVGNANAMAVNAIQQSTSFRLPFSTLFSKFLMLAALALLVGQRLFTALVWNPALKRDQDHLSFEMGRPAAWITFHRIGLIALLISIAIGILGQAGQSTGRELAFPWSPEMGSLFTETRLGVIWLARLALSMLAVWLVGRKETPLRDWSTFAVNLSLLFTVTLTSHAATEARPSLPILADWIHLIGMTFWLGGLVYFFTAIGHINKLDGQLRTQLTSLLTSQFSFNALIFVGLIGLTGFYSAYLRVGSVPALLDTLYGHALLIKQAFVAGLLVIAATNLLVVSPQLKRDRLQGVATVGLVERFGKLLILELTFAGLLLASVSFLTYLPPAKVVSPVSDFARAKQVDDIDVELNISPARVGENTFMLMLMSSDGHPINAKKVLLRFTPSQANIPPSELQMIGDGSGMYTAKGTYLSLPGKWQVQAVVRREDEFDAFANFDLTLRTPGSVEKSIASSKVTGGLFLSISFLAALITITMPSYPRIRVGLGIPLTLLMTGVGVYYLAHPISVELAQVNPISANQESVKAGEDLYTVNCAPCHGLSGKGDGPLGLTFNPGPADLTQHAIPGVHTDAQLFEWITNGFPGSWMPAFKSALSDTDRWNLVNFLRTLAPR